jgi:hypothetical protein
MIRRIRHAAAISRTVAIVTSMNETDWRTRYGDTA